MVYEFEVVAEDIIAFRIYCSHHVPECRRMQVYTLVFLTLFAMATFVVVGLLRSSELLQIVLLLVTLFTILIIAANLAQPDAATTRTVQKDIRRGMYEQLLGKQTMLAEADSFVLKSAFWEVKRYWKTINNVVVTEHHVLIFVDRMSGNVIPKRAFADDEQWNSFVQQIRLYRESAIQSDQVIP